MPRPTLRAFVARHARNTLIVVAPVTALMLLFVLASLGGVYAVATSSRTSAGDFAGPVVGLVVFVPFLLLCLRKIARTLAAKRDPMRDADVAKTCARLGTSFEQLEARVDPELASAPRVEGGDVYQLTWCLLAPGIWAFDLVPYEEVVWAYGRVTSHSVNFVPTGTTHSVRVYTRNPPYSATPLSLFLSAEGTERLLGLIRHAAPWARVGYDAALDREWYQRRAQVFAEVDAKRKAMQSLRG